MIIGFGNNTVSSLAADVTASQTTIQVMPGEGAKFSKLLSSDYVNTSNPQKIYAKITLTDAKETVFEVCHLTAVNNDMLTVVRGQEGTTAKGWALNDVVANFATRGSENQFVQIEQLQSGNYTSGVAGGSANALTIELPATYFINSSTDWALRTPIVVYPTLNNTGASTLQLVMGGRVLGTFPLYKGNKAQLVANDILKDVGLVCLMDKTKTFFNVANPGAIYAGLGTAAFKDVVTSMTDVTTGRVPVVGWMGLGNAGYGALPMGVTSQFLIYPTSQPEVPANCAGFQAAYGDTRRAQIVLGTNGNVYSRFSSSDVVLDTVTEWATHYTTKYPPPPTDLSNYYTKQQSDNRFALINSSYTKSESDNKYQLKGNYALVGDSYTKSDSDNKYQLKNTASLAANGWHKDTSTGIITQWGTASGGSGAIIYYPIAFPTSVVAVVVMDCRGNNLATVTSRTPSAFALAANVGTIQFNYIAIGY